MAVKPSRSAAPTNAPLEALIDRAGLQTARQAAEASEYATGLVPVIDAIAATPEQLWRPYDVLKIAGVVSAFNLDRVLRKTVGFEFIELVDRARVHRALGMIAESDASVDAVAEAYWPPRTRAQQIKELQANVVIQDNKLSSRENLDAAFRRVLDMGLDAVVATLRA